MRNVLSGIVDVCRVLALLILAAGGLGVAYLTLVTRLPSDAQASTAATAADKIGPTYSYAVAPVIAPPVRSAAAAASRPAKAQAAVQQSEETATVSRAVQEEAKAAAAQPLRTEPARVRTASLETGSLSDVTEVDDEPRRSVSRKSLKRAAGAAGCEHFRSFDPATQTYRSYDGRIRECRIL